MIKDKSIFIKNIYYMLSYAFTSLNEGVFEYIDKENFDNIHNLFSAILSKGIGLQLKRGLYKEYINTTEDLSVVRGKINIQKTIKNKIQRKQLVSCDFDMLSENNLLNQILKTTSLLLIKQKEVDIEYKSELKKDMMFFDSVDEIDPINISWSAIRFQRNNSTYRILISLCQLIIEGMLLTTDSGEYKLASLVDDQRMNRLYEKFILEYYIKEYPNIKVSSSKIDWAVDDGVRTMLPNMQSDIMLEGKNNKILIIDAKYYTHTTQVQYDVHTLHSNNLYQIFTYVKNKQEEYSDEGNVAGMLLYALTDERIQPNYSYLMSGNQISVEALDLNKPFEDIKNQLNTIVDLYF